MSAVAVGAPRVQEGVSASAIYEGTIRHRRFIERAHSFRHRIALFYLDLDELDGLLDGALVVRRPGIVRFRRGDYLGDRARPLADAVREQLRRDGGHAPEGPIRVLTHVRTLGHCFNPVSFYYCFDESERLDAVIAEVTSTPWGERHSYVLHRSGAGRVLSGSFAKALHVSPFMEMKQRYELRASEPGERLSVHIESSERGRRAFDATLSLARAPLTRGGVAAVVARYPAATLRVLALIYGHALALKLKGVPLRRHPGGAS
jgi:DUF1365 family protein